MAKIKTAKRPKFGRARALRAYGYGPGAVAAVAASFLLPVSYTHLTLPTTTAARAAGGVNNRNDAATAAAAPGP